MRALFIGVRGSGGGRQRGPGVLAHASVSGKLDTYDWWSLQDCEFQLRQWRAAVAAADESTHKPGAIVNCTVLRGRPGCAEHDDCRANPELAKACIPAEERVFVEVNRSWFSVAIVKGQIALLERAVADALELSAIPAPEAMMAALKAEADARAVHAEARTDFMDELARIAAQHQAQAEAGNDPRYHIRSGAPALVRVAADPARVHDELDRVARQQDRMAAQTPPEAGDDYSDPRYTGGASALRAVAELQPQEEREVRAFGPSRPQVENGPGGATVTWSRAEDDRSASPFRDAIDPGPSRRDGGDR